MTAKDIEFQFSKLYLVFQHNAPILRGNKDGTLTIAKVRPKEKRLLHVLVDGNAWSQIDDLVKATSEGVSVTLYKDRSQEEMPGLQEATFVLANYPLGAYLLICCCAFGALLLCLMPVVLYGSYNQAWRVRNLTEADKKRILSDAEYITINYPKLVRQSKAE